MLVLHEVLRSELSNFSRELNLKLGIDDDHRGMVGMSNDLWFRRMEIKEEGEKRQNAKKNESSFGSYGFANEARGELVAALDSSNSTIGHGRFRARTSDDHKDSRLPRERTEFSEECRKKVSRIHK